MKTRYALVLSGGGTRGIYQIGVWKALTELDIRYDLIIGSSIGALNGALIVQGDWEEAHRLWMSMTPEKIIDLPEKEPGFGNRMTNYLGFLKRFIKNSGIGTEPMKQLIEKAVDEEKIRNSRIRFGLTTFNMSAFKQEELFLDDLPSGQLVSYLLAATAFPGLQTQKIAGKRYLDGGMADNIPYQLIRDSGYKNIIVVDISGLGRNKTPDYVGVNLVYIKNSMDFSKLSTLFGVFDFSREFLKCFEELGYLDTMKVFGRCCGIDYFIEEDDFSREIGKKLSSRQRILEYRQTVPYALRYYLKPEMAVADLMARDAGLYRIKKYRFREICDEADQFFQRHPQKQNKIYLFFRNLKDSSL